MHYWTTSLGLLSSTFAFLPLELRWDGVEETSAISASLEVEVVLKAMKMMQQRGVVCAYLLSGGIWEVCEELKELMMVDWRLYDFLQVSLLRWGKMDEVRHWDVASSGDRRTHVFELVYWVIVIAGPFQTLSQSQVCVLFWPPLLLVFALSLGSNASSRRFSEWARAKKNCWLKSPKLKGRLSGVNTVTRRTQMQPCRTWKLECSLEETECLRSLSALVDHHPIYMSHSLFSSLHV